MATLKSRDPAIWDMIQKGIYGPCMYHILSRVESDTDTVTYDRAADELWVPLYTADHIRTTLINTLSALTMRNH